MLQCDQCLINIKLLKIKHSGSLAGDTPSAKPFGQLASAIVGLCLVGAQIGRRELCLGSLAAQSCFILGNLASEALNAAACGD